MNDISNARIVLVALAALDCGAKIPDRTPTETRVLWCLHDQSPLADAEVTLRIRSEKAHVSRAVGALINAGLIEHQPSDVHKRQRNLFLSPDGHRSIAEFSERQGLPLADAIDALSYQESEALRTLANHFRRGPVRHQETRLAVQVRTCKPDDLAWLLTQRFQHLSHSWLGAGRRTQFANELAEHLAQSDSIAGSWLATNWGRRIGGCVINCDLDDPENAWFRLLELPTDLTAAQALLRAAIAWADETTYALLQYKAVGEGPFLGEVLSTLGFDPRNHRQVTDHISEVTWARRLRPAYKPRSS